MALSFIPHPIVAAIIGGALCSGCRGATSEARQQTAEPTPTVAAPSVDDRQAPTTTAPTRTCEGTGLARFPCEHERICATIDTTDELVTLPEFLCVARTASSPAGSLRVGDILRLLPVAFRKGFTLKHGTKEKGLRGHPQELMAEVVSDALAQNSQSADLDFPRVIMWDDTSGFTISYNGGLRASDGTTRAQTGAGRLDLMGWDAETKAFALWAVDLPIEPREEGGPWNIAPYQPHDEDDNCASCHGPRSRPIWPMYPDWPGFYGSDNDELSGPSGHQKAEREFLTYFRECVAPGPASTDRGGSPDCDGPREAAAQRLGADSPHDLVDQRRRYDTLFAADVEHYFSERFDSIDAAAVRDYIEGLDDKYSARLVAKIRTPLAVAAVREDASELRAWLGLELHRTWPYRPNRNEQSTEPSRAFFHRPNLRLGVLYNRLTALSVFEAIRADPVYQQFDTLVAFSWMDCGGLNRTPSGPAALTRFSEAAHGRLQARNVSLGDTKSAAYRVPYPALLAALELRVRDVDIRYSYGNRRFDRFDNSWSTPKPITNVMKLGYLRYDGGSDYSRANGAKLYWNSYFDGSATTDELLVALMLRDIATRRPEYAALFELQTLTTKYERFVSRQVLDAPFFERMDGFSGWFPLPFPKRLEPVHHRQSFMRKQGGAPVFHDQYRAVCAQLGRDLG